MYVVVCGLLVPIRFLSGNGSNGGIRVSCFAGAMFLQTSLSEVFGPFDWGHAVHTQAGPGVGKYYQTKSKTVRASSLFACWAPQRLSTPCWSDAYQVTSSLAGSKHRMLEKSFCFDVLPFTARLGEVTMSCRGFADFHANHFRSRRAKSFSEVAHCIDRFSMVQSFIVFLNAGIFQRAKSQNQKKKNRCNVLPFLIF